MYMDKVDREQDEFRHTMNAIIRGYNMAWELWREIPNTDWITDEISGIAIENIEAMCMEENADNPVFWNSEEDRDEIIQGYTEMYYSTGYVELLDTIHLFLKDLKLTYIGYTETNDEVLMNPAQNLLFNFEMYYGVIIDV
jgi:hypothetical protein